METEEQKPVVSKSEQRRQAALKTGSPIPQESTGIPITYIQLHDAFLPPGLGSGQLTISTSGAKAVTSITKVAGGFDVIHPKGRRFFIPAGNVGFAEYA